MSSLFRIQKPTQRNDLNEQNMQSSLIASHWTQFRRGPKLMECIGHEMQNGKSSVNSLCGDTLNSRACALPCSVRRADRVYYSCGEKWYKQQECTRSSKIQLCGGTVSPYKLLTLHVMLLTESIIKFLNCTNAPSNLKMEYFIIQMKHAVNLSHSGFDFFRASLSRARFHSPEWHHIYNISFCHCGV